MTGWDHLEDCELHFEDIPRRATPRPGETTAIACIVGLIGSALMIQAVFFGIFLSSIYYIFWLDRVNTVSLAMDLGPIIWGFAFLATHILHLQQMPDLVQRSFLRVTVFTCLAFSASILFTLLVMTLLGLVHLALFLADLIVDGYVITAAGLVVWMCWRRLISDGTALTE